MEQLVDLGQMVTFLLVFTRLAAFIAVCPVFAIRGVPPAVKAGLAFVLALALLPAAQAQAAPPPLDSFLGFALALAKEAAVGLGLGIFTGLVFQGFLLAGQYIGFQIGFAMAEMMNPGTEGERALVSRLMWLFALVFFVSIDGHHLLIAGLAQSFELVPLGAALPQMKTTLFMAKTYGGLYLIALTVAAPVMAVLLATDAILGLMVRMVPQINVFMLGFPVKILAGLFALMVAVPVIGWVMTRAFGRMTEDLLVLMKLLGSG
ncbi:MAG: flagellar biosynthetic protein FliR [Bacillota bacterium]|jgi:flagellar biosynthetic protein FliR